MTLEAKRIGGIATWYQNHYDTGGNGQVHVGNSSGAQTGYDISRTPGGFSVGHDPVDETPTLKRRDRTLADGTDSTTFTVQSAYNLFWVADSFHNADMQATLWETRRAVTLFDNGAGRGTALDGWLTGAELENFRSALGPDTTEQYTFYDAPMWPSGA